MPLTYDAWMKRVAGTPAPTRDAALEARLRHQAAVSAAALTGDQHWDHFLRLVNGAREQVEKDRQPYLAMLADPAVVEHSVLLQSKLMLSNLQGQAEALEWAIALPAALMRAGDKEPDKFKDRPRGTPVAKSQAA